MRPERSGCEARLVALRCLIVDDSLRFLEVACRGLSRDGIEVVGTATTSAEALDEVQRLRPDVVLVDVSLGAESGFDLSRQLAVVPDSGLQIVLISTRAEEDLHELIAESPAVGFIPKSRLSAKAVRELVNAR
jgi:DNA-binding NarL/FixJ family response regulator